MQWDDTRRDCVLGDIKHVPQPPLGRDSYDFSTFPMKTRCVGVASFAF